MKLILIPLMIMLSSCACDGEKKPMAHQTHNGHRYLTFWVCKDHAMVHDPDCPCMQKNGSYEN